MKSLSWFILIVFAISACGIKPNHVEAPNAAKKDVFPHVYPDLRNDPAPKAVP